MRGVSRACSIPLEETSIEGPKHWREGGRHGGKTGITLCRVGYSLCSSAYAVGLETQEDRVLTPEPIHSVPMIGAQTTSTISTAFRTACL